MTSNETSNSLGGPEQLTTVNGSGRAQIGSVSFQLDGGNNTAGLRGTGNPAPNPEAVQEFRVITNSYAAEYGRYPAGIVDVVTKSGTNQFHGAVFEFFRNEKLNAKRWAPPGTTAAKDPLDRNQFGAALGGPIQKDKTFFFVSYSGLRQEETYYRNTAVVPTARERAGDFSQSAIKPRDPATNQPFPGGIIPSSRFDRGGAHDPGPVRPAVQPAQQLLRGAPGRPPQHRRGDPQAGPQPLADPHPRAELLLPDGHRHPAAVPHRQHPLGRSRLQVDPAQPEPGRHLDAEPDHDQPAPRHLHAAVRRPRQQPDDLARRPELEVHDPGRPDAAAPDRVRVLHGPDVDRRSRRRQRLLRGAGQREHQPRATTRSSSGRRSRTRRSSTTRCSTTTASSPSTAARRATPTPTSCSACPAR